MGYADPAAQGEYQRQWNAARRAQYVAAAGGACKRCGSTVDLEFAGFKRLRISWSWAPARLEAALAQCELVCRGCRIGPVEIRHGTSHGYERHRCRCPLCVEWRRLDGQRYRERRRARERAAPRPAEAVASAAPPAPVLSRPAPPKAPRAPQRAKVPAVAGKSRETPATSGKVLPAEPAAPLVTRPPLPPSAERAAIWSSVVAKMVSERLARMDRGGWSGPRVQ
jgi:hypothetical protein